MKLVSSILQPFRHRGMRTSFVPRARAAAPIDAQGSGSAAAARVVRDGPPPAGASAWLFPQVVLLDCDVRDKDDVLDVAASTLARFHGVDAGVVARALWRREAAMTTALGHGVAVPHARIDGIAEPVTLLIRTRRPIPFEAPDRKAVSQLFVIVVPADGEPSEHLRLLANVAQLFSQAAFRERIDAATDMRSARRAFEEFSRVIDDGAAPPGASDPATASSRRGRSPPG